MADYERVLMYKQQQVCLFKIPPLSTSKGHYLDDWKEMFWEGGVKLVEKGSNLILQFINQRDLSIVAVSPLPDDPYEAIQKTIDSQRGYAIRLMTPNGQYQWVGCVFRDRNDAFDLNAILQDFVAQRDIERNPQKYKNEFQPTNDFSLKEGQKIQISIEGTGTKKKSQTSTTNPSLNAFKFDMPPDFAPVQQKPNSFKIEDSSFNINSNKNNNSSFNDFSMDWDNFTSSNAQSQPKSQSNFGWSQSPPIQQQQQQYQQQQQQQLNKQTQPIQTQLQNKKVEQINLLDL